MRITQIVSGELAKDKLMLEEKIESIVNDASIDVYKKLNLIKKTLKKIVIIESMYVKWTNYITPQEVNNNEQNFDFEEVK